jgi:hypothetical protein
MQTRVEGLVPSDRCRAEDEGSGDRQVGIIFANGKLAPRKRVAS